MEKYNKVINSLMGNDHNGSWNEIIEEVEYDYEKAIEIVVECLERIIEEEGYEGEELQFYVDNLNELVG